MLFRKKMKKDCLYCQHAKAVNESVLICLKRNDQAAVRPCFRFKYDPCKRIPPRPKAPDFSAYDKDDFSL
ncbi:MAG: hypothetical protein E7453_04590 [Ruminococcaceae bacterium]|nr:hypothetical protein [Oscillospiraceae bacterium]